MAPIRLKPILPCLLGLGLGLYLALDGFIKGLPVPQEWIDETARSASRLSSAGLPAQILCVLIMAPLVEEVIYRGLCLPYLRRGFPLPLAVVFQAALFGFFHGAKLQAAYAFAAGLLLGVVFLLCRSVWASLVVHITFNSAGIFFHRLSLALPADFWVVTGIAGALLLLVSLRHLILRRPDNAMET